jgi:hypothetical protein
MNVCVSLPPSTQGNQCKIFSYIKKMKLHDAPSKMVPIILDLYRLTPFLEYFDQYNASKNLPYHNRYHSFKMVLNCYEGSYYENIQSYGARRGLLVAALFHDFNHTGGRLHDSENIKLAVNGLLSAHDFVTTEHKLSSGELYVAKDCIEITQYPFENDPFVPTQMVIRDADLMQAYEEDDSRLLAQYVGLKEEIQISKKQTFSSEEFADGMKSFLDEQVVWYTNWAQEKSKALNWDAKKERVYQLLRNAK